MVWQLFSESDQLNNILQHSEDQLVIIFKHSTRCHLSTKVKNRLEKQWTQDLEDVSAYILDLLNFREISNQISETFGVEHQSPQLLLIKNRQCSTHWNHNEINITNLRENIIIQKN